MDNSKQILDAAMNCESKTEICRIHGEYTSDKTPRGKWTGCPKCMLEQAQEHSLANQAEALGTRKTSDTLKKLRIEAQIPKRFRNRCLGNYAVNNPGQAKAMKISEKYLGQFTERFDSGGGLVFMGKPGTGKTHLACAIGNSLVERGHRVLFTDVYDLIDTIKERAFSEKVCSEREAVQAFVGVDLLILDEVGAQLGSEWERLTLFKVINERYKACVPTILITNLPHDDFKKYVGERIEDRMREGGGAFVNFDWDSHRGHVYRKPEAA